jgi:hypothetical protein
LREVGATEAFLFLSTELFYNNVGTAVEKPLHAAIDKPNKHSDGMGNELVQLLQSYDD